MIGGIWNEVIIRPMINGLVILYYLFFNNFGLSIIVFTVAIRLGLVPLTLKQSRQMKAMSSLAPKMKELQERYSDDKSRASQETMRLYKENGVSPIGCLGPLIIQMPIFLGLFWALRGVLPSTPEELVRLAEHTYTWLPQISESIPVDSHFLWLDLSRTSSNNPFSFLLPVLVGGSMLVMQKMTSMPSVTATQASTQKMMLWMMPIMFGFFTLNFEAGLALYWIVSNIVGIVIQGFVTGWDPLFSLVPSRKSNSLEVAPDQIPLSKPEEANGDAKGTINGNDGKNRRRSDRARHKGTRRRSRGSRNRGH